MSIFLMQFVTFCRYKVNSMILHAIFLYIYVYELPLFSYFFKNKLFWPGSSHFLIKLMLISFQILRIFLKIYFEFCNSIFTLETIPAIFFRFLQILIQSQKSDNSKIIHQSPHVISL